jgi:hypothetical protein
VLRQSTALFGSRDFRGSSRLKRLAHPIWHYFYVALRYLKHLAQAMLRVPRHRHYLARALHEHRPQHAIEANKLMREPLRVIEDGGTVNGKDLVTAGNRSRIARTPQEAALRFRGQHHLLPCVTSRARPCPFRLNHYVTRLEALSDLRGDALHPRLPLRPEPTIYHKLRHCWFP